MKGFGWEGKAQILWWFDRIEVAFSWIVKVLVLGRVKNESNIRIIIKLKGMIRWHLNEIGRGIQGFIDFNNLLTEMFLCLKVILCNNFFYWMFGWEGVDTNNGTTADGILFTFLDITLYIFFSFLSLGFIRIALNIILRFNFLHSYLLKFSFASIKLYFCLWLLDTSLQKMVRFDWFVMIDCCYHRILHRVIAVMICSEKIIYFFVEKWLRFKL